MEKFHILVLTPDGNLVVGYHAPQVPGIGHFIVHNCVRYEVIYISWVIKTPTRTNTYVDEVRLYVEKASK